MKKNKYIILMFFAVLFLVLIQRFALCVEYKPVIDDWFLYGDTYKTMDELWQGFIIPNAKFSIRPLAGLIDVFFIAPLFNNLWIAEAITALMLVAGVFMICDVLRKNEFPAGGIFIALMCLFPLNLEATYWLAAAIRNCVSLFFVGLSAMLLQKFFETNKTRFLAVYAFVGFITVSLYEPAVVMYLLFSCFLILRHKNPKLLIIPIVHAVCIAVYYKLNANSFALESRGTLLTSGIIGHALVITKMTVKILGELNWDIFYGGLKRGVKLIAENKLVIQSIITVICSAAIGILSNHFSKDKKISAKRLICGIAAMCAGMMLFYILEDTRLTVRTVFFSFIGIGLIFEELLLLVPKKARFICNSALISALSLCLTISGMGVVSQYMETSQKDTETANRLLAAGAWKSDSDINNNLYLFNTEAYYKSVGSVEWFESIRGVGSGNSELTGCMRHVSGLGKTGRAIPVLRGEEAEIENIDESSFFMLDGTQVIKLLPTSGGDIIYMTDENGVTRGLLKGGGGKYVFESYPAYP